VGLLKNVKYDTAGNFTASDVNKIEISGVLATLKLGDLLAQSFEQKFLLGPTGFTVDNAKATFRGETFFASYATSINADRGTAGLTGTAFGGAVITGGKLDLTGETVKFVTYPAGNVDLSKKMAIEVDYTPDYSGAPTSLKYIFAAGLDSSTFNNLTSLYHHTDGFMYFQVYKADGTIAHAIQFFDDFVAVSGTKVTFSLDIDSKGNAKLFKDGVQLGPTRAVDDTGSPRTTFDYFHVGTDKSQTLKSDFFLENFALYNNIQRDANYTLGDATIGLIEQLNQSPLASIFGIDFSTFDQNWNNTTNPLTHTKVGAPVLSSGKLLCAGNQAVFYAHDTTSKETFKFKYTPTYSGEPAANAVLMAVHNGTNNNDKITLHHDINGTGELILTIYNNFGTVKVMDVVIAAFNIVQDVELEIELNVDSDNGLSEVYVEGALLGGNTRTGWGRGGIASRIYIGSDDDVHSNSDAKFDDFICFSNIQHTSGYTKGYTVPPIKYVENTSILPINNYPGVGCTQCRYICI